jgi:hypothetical protein
MIIRCSTSSGEKWREEERKWGGRERHYIWGGGGKKLYLRFSRFSGRLKRDPTQLSPFDEVSLDHWIRRKG